MAAELLIATLRQIWQLLESLHVPAAVMGGMAMSAWQYARTTRDVDLLVAADASEMNSLLRQLEEAGFHPKNESRIVALGELKILQLLYEPPDAFLDMHVDLLVADSPYHLEAIKRRITVILPDTNLEIAVLTCEDLILHKLLAGRLIDMADVAALIALNHETLDRQYLARWLDSLKIKDDFSAIWQKALPDQPFLSEDSTRT